MLLRSASSPILNTWVPAGKEHSPDHSADEFGLHAQLHMARSVNHFSSSISLTSSPTVPSPSPRRMMTRAMSDGDLWDPFAAPKRGRASNHHGLPSISLTEDKGGKEEEALGPSTRRLLSSLGLDGLMVDGVQWCCAVDAKSSAHVSTLVFGGGCAGSGGRICGGRRGGGGPSGDDGAGGGFGFSDSNKGTDVYYLQMIEANPGNSLVLGNYARFLEQVRGDLSRAEEYCQRAILANPGDADVLSLYANLVWQTTKDSERAERYFDRAVQAAPEDCYVMASYARFLWDAEEEEEKDGGVALFQGSTAPSIATAS